VSGTEFDPGWSRWHEVDGGARRCLYGICVGGQCVPVRHLYTNFGLPTSTVRSSRGLARLIWSLSRHVPTVEALIVEAQILCVRPLERHAVGAEPLRRRLQHHLDVDNLDVRDTG
jgi:hypothetical protein